MAGRNVSFAPTPAGTTGLPPANVAQSAAPTTSRPGARAPRKKPFGYDFIMGVSPSFVVLTLIIMLFVCWWQTVQLDSLLGTERLLRVRRVLDGDQFLANTEDGYLVKVRLRAADAPELEQPHGKEATEALRVMLQAPHTDVVAFIHEKDHEGRYISDVFTQTGIREFQYVQARMLSGGFAWHQGAFDRRGKLKEAMDNATRDGIGLWGEEEEPIAPWRFRREQEKKVGTPQPHAPLPDPSHTHTHSVSSKSKWNATTAKTPGLSAASSAAATDATSAIGKTKCPTPPFR